MSTRLPTFFVGHDYPNCCQCPDKNFLIKKKLLFNNNFLMNIKNKFPSFL